MNELRKSAEDAIEYAVLETLNNNTTQVQNTPKVVEWIISSVLKGIDNYFTIGNVNSALLESHPLRLVNEVSAAIGLNGSNSSYGSPFYGVRKTIVLRALEFLNGDAALATKRASAQLADSQNELQLQGKVLSAAKCTFELAKIELAHTLHGGLSGSGVMRVYVQDKPDSDTRLAVLKYTRQKKDFDAEVRGLELAGSSWLATHADVRALSSEVAIDGTQYFVLITEIAFPPASNHQNVPSLYDQFVNRNTARCSGAVSGLSQLFLENYVNAKRLHIKLKDLLPQMNVAWSEDFGRCINDASFWFPIGLPDPREPTVIDADRIFCNPLHLLTFGNFSNDDALELRFCVQHGDLNARNVLFDSVTPTHQTERPVFIDFEKTRESSALLDASFLSLSILGSGGKTTIGDEYWKTLPGAFCEAVVDNRRSDFDHGAWQFKLDSAQHLFMPLHEITSQDRYRHHHFTVQLCATLGACALVMSWYEIRSLIKGRKDTLEALFWSHLYFRIATYVFHRIANSTPHGGVPQSNLTDSLEWLFT